jgi:hypothetical protein
MEDIRVAAAALRQNILAVGGPDTPLLDTLDQGDLTTRLHKFRVSFLSLGETYGTVPVLRSRET